MALDNSKASSFRVVGDLPRMMEEFRNVVEGIPRRAERVNPSTTLRTPPSSEGGLRRRGRLDALELSRAIERPRKASRLVTKQLSLNTVLEIRTDVNSSERTVTPPHHKAAVKSRSVSGASFCAPSMKNVTG